jgi:hypothetical protein
MSKGEQRELERFLRDLEKWNRVVVKESAGKTVERSGEPDQPEDAEADRQTFIVVRCDTAKHAPDAKLA